MHVEVSAICDILVCLEKIDACERKIKEKTGIEAVIHMDPIVTDDEEVNKVRLEIAARVSKLYDGTTIHDFRMVKGERQSNLIFDVLVPADCKLTNSQIKAAVTSLAADIDPTYCCVITVDKDFSGGNY